MERHDGGGPHLPTVLTRCAPVDLTCWPSGQIEASVACQQHPLQEMGLSL